MKKTLPASVWIRWNYDGDEPYLEVSETFKDAVLPLSAYEKNDIGYYGLQRPWRSLSGGFKFWTTASEMPECPKCGCLPCIAVEAKHEAVPCSVCRRSHGPEIRHECE
jgi:hypothetical protein